MGDPLSVAASIIACIQASAKIIQYVSDVENAEEDSDQCLILLTHAIERLTRLRAKTQAKATSDGFNVSLQELSRQNGLFAQFQRTSDELERILRAQSSKNSSLKRTYGKLKWPFQKKDVLKYLEFLEGFNRIVDRVLQDDLKDVVEDMHHMTQETHQHVQLLLSSTAALELGIGGVKLELGAKLDDLKVAIDDKTLIEQKDTTRKFQEEARKRLRALCLNYNEYHQTVKREEGTVLWIFERDAYIQWAKSKRGLLWCQGDPGAGKTIMSSLLIDTLREEALAEENVLFIYLRYKERSRQRYLHLLAALLAQLVERLPASVWLNLASVQPEADLTSALLEEDLLAILKVQQQQTRIIIDGFDECINDDLEDTQDQLLALIQALQDLAAVFVTCRWVPLDLRAATFSIAAQDEDIRKFALGEISRSKGPLSLSARVKQDPALREEIVQAVVGRAKGMFLLAALHMNSMKVTRSTGHVRQNLKRLPGKLDDAYKETMDRMKHSEGNVYQDALRIFSWVSLARRLLSVDEMRFALAMEDHDQTTISDEYLVEPSYMIESCRGLLKVEGSTVRLVHETFRDYLQRNMEQYDGNAQLHIATTCLKYLLLDNFATQSYKKLVGNTEFLKKNVLLEYAATNWGHHLRLCKEHSDGRQLAVELFSNQPNAMTAYHFLYSCSDGSLFPRWMDREAKMESSSLIHSFAYFGLEGTLQDLFDSGNIDINSRDRMGFTALHLAAMMNYTKIGAMISERGADIYIQATGLVAIQLAAGFNSVDFVRLLVARGADPAYQKTGNQKTPLICAAEKGHVQTVQALLTMNCGINLSDCEGETALAKSARFRKWEVARLLLAQPELNIAASERVKRRGRTPLGWATQAYRTDWIRIFASLGAVVDFVDYGGSTPLMLAARNSAPGTLKCLIGLGANVFVTDGSGINALHWAARDNATHTIPVLLEHGHTVDERDPDQRTAVIWAVVGNGANAIEQLVKCGADLSARDGNTMTALHWVAWMDFLTSINMLLKLGADPNLRTGTSDEMQGCSFRQDMYAWGPANFIVQPNRAKALIGCTEHKNCKIGTCPIRKDVGLSTPLMLATRRGAHRLVEVLLQAAPAIVNVPDESGNTPLKYAAELEPKENIAKMLRDAGGKL